MTKERADTDLKTIKTSLRLAKIISTFRTFTYEQSGCICREQNWRQKHKSVWALRVGSEQQLFNSRLCFGIYKNVRPGGFRLRTVKNIVMNQHFWRAVSLKSARLLFLLWWRNTRLPPRKRETPRTLNAAALRWTDGWTPKATGWTFGFFFFF